jgi:Glycoside-hydrolase family GH114
LTQQDAIIYYQFLAGQASSLNMGISIKNALEILPSVQDVATFAVNEQCVEFNECDKYDDFLNTKAVLHIEYVDSIDNLSKRDIARIQRRRANKKRQATTAVVSALSQQCTPKNAPTLNTKMSTVIKTSNLDGVVQYCDGTVATTQT